VDRPARLADVRQRRRRQWQDPRRHQQWRRVSTEDKGDKGIVLCFDEKNGKLLWQATHDKLPTGQVNDWPEQGICSSACVVGNRAYYSATAANWSAPIWRV
jgi:outer membrane protein assembly factor BamB